MCDPFSDHGVCAVEVLHEVFGARVMLSVRIADPLSGRRAGS